MVAPIKQYRLPIHGPNSPLAITAKVTPGKAKTEEPIMAKYLNIKLLKTHNYYLQSQQLLSNS